MADKLRRTKSSSERLAPPQRPPLGRSKSSPGDDLHRLFSASFMDDHSYYHYHAHDTESVGTEDDDLTLAEGETEKTGDEEEVRDGVLDLRDTESRLSKLERLKSSKSIKDPNLVSLPVSILGALSHLPRRVLTPAIPFDSLTRNTPSAVTMSDLIQLMCLALPVRNLYAKSYIGDVERSGRPREPKELDIPQEMGSHSDCLVLYFHLSYFLIHGRARFTGHGLRTSYHELG